MSLTEKIAKLPDNSLQFLHDGYFFQERARAARGRDAGDSRPLPLRLLGKPALLVRGAEGVELFYNDELMKARRSDAGAGAGPALIDVLGTNTDPNEWDEPRRFNPDRFLGVDGEQVAAFVPQGGSSVYTGHRCPGEKIAVTCLAVTVAALSRPGVELETGGLEYSWTAMPPRPDSGVRVSVKA